MKLTTAFSNLAGATGAKAVKRKTLEEEVSGGRCLLMRDMSTVEITEVTISSKAVRYNCVQMFTYIFKLLLVFCFLVSNRKQKPNV